MRYAAVSAVALGIDVALLWLFVTRLAIREFVAAAIAYAAGLAVHYALSVRHVFAFRRLGHRRRIEATVYALSGLLGIALSAAVVQAGTMLGQPLAISKAAAVAGTFVAVFLMRKAVLFSGSAAP